MKNEEKAIELVKQFQSCINNDVPRDAAVMACLMEIAEWKDQQFEEERKELIAKANQAVTNSHENGAQFMKERLIEKLKEMEIEDGDIEDFANEEQSSNYGLSDKFISRLKKQWRNSYESKTHQKIKKKDFLF